MEYAPPDDAFEQFLSRLNETTHAEFGHDSPARTDLLTCQIFGLPRSGTTLLYQLLGMTGAVGYPSNVMAFYWRAPHVGATLQRKLAASPATMSLHSLGGRTPEPLDPHEFGYFWRAALGHSANEMEPTAQPIPASHLQATLDAVNSAFDAPTVYKNFLVPAHVPYLTRALQRQRFVMVRRPLLDVAKSLLSVRRRVGVAPHEWFGVRPAGTKLAYPDEMSLVADQVVLLDRAINSCGILADPTCLTVDLADLQRDPRGTVRIVLEHVEADTHAADMERIPPSLKRGSEYGSPRSASDDALEAVLQTLTDK